MRASARRRLYRGDHRLGRQDLDQGDGAQGAFATSAPTHASAASYNNQWGVPLSLARMPATTRFGVFEIGMNHAGEIAALVEHGAAACRGRHPASRRCISNISTRCRGHRRRQGRDFRRLARGRRRDRQSRRRDLRAPRGSSAASPAPGMSSASARARRGGAPHLLRNPRRRLAWRAPRFSAGASITASARRAAHIAHQRAGRAARRQCLRHRFGAGRGGARGVHALDRARAARNRSNARAGRSP